MEDLVVPSKIEYIEHIPDVEDKPSEIISEPDIKVWWKKTVSAPPKKEFTES